MKKLLISLACLGLLATNSAMANHYKNGKKCPHEDFMKKIDTNNDGNISKEESSNFNSQRFTDMDTNKDGQVTPEERKSFSKQKRDQWKQKCKAEKTNSDAGTNGNNN